MHVALHDIRSLMIEDGDCCELGGAGVHPNRRSCSILLFGVIPNAATGPKIGRYVPPDGRGPGLLVGLDDLKDRETSSQCPKRAGCARNSRQGRLFAAGHSSSASPWVCQAAIPRLGVLGTDMIRATSYKTSRASSDTHLSPTTMRCSNSANETAEKLEASSQWRVPRRETQPCAAQVLGRRSQPFPLPPSNPGT